MNDKVLVRYSGHLVLLDDLQQDFTRDLLFNDVVNELVYHQFEEVMLYLRLLEADFVMFLVLHYKADIASN